jgi:glyoxylase-like metal-dependent hydrolase (beta-lactamase superfamily II)
MRNYAHGGGRPLACSVRPSDGDARIQPNHRGGATTGGTITLTEPTSSPSNLAQGWFSIQELEPGILMVGEPLHVEDPKSFLIIGSQRSLLIDTGTGVGNLGELVAPYTDLPITVVNSHSHWDHIGGNRYFADVMVPVAEVQRVRRGYTREEMAQALAPDQLLGPLPAGFNPHDAAIPPREPDGTLHGGEVFDIGGRFLEVIAAPGHSPGLLVFVDRANGILFGTDAVYRGALYAQEEESDLYAYRRTLAFLAALAPSLRVVYSSHGPVPMEPKLIPAMASALAQILAGRQPDRTWHGALKHEFGEFSFLIASEQ